MATRRALNQQYIKITKDTKTDTDFKEEEREIGEVRDLQALARNDLRLSSARSDGSCSKVLS
jgi:hypothetical protein